MSLALADIVWPSMVLLEGLWTWWVILAGLVIELVFLRFITDLSWKKLILADILMNAVSSIMGFIVILIGGAGVSLVSGFTYERLFNLGTFNPYSWGVTLVFSALVNTALESLMLVLAFRQKLKWWGYLVLFIANTASVGLALYEVITNPPRM
jgi:hypothetical protein